MQFATLRLGKGPRIHYAEQGRADGEPIVFIHGWPDSWFSFSRVLPFLPERIRAVALDQRGFGDSERPTSGYTIPEMAADVVALFDALGISRVTLVGHSFGSFVARQAAIARPERVAGLILIGTGFVQSNPVVRELLEILRDLPDPIPTEFARDFQKSTAYRPLPPEFFERIIAESLKLPAHLWRLTIERLLEHDDAPQLARIQAPVRLLWGDRDALFSRTNQDRFLAALPAAQLTIYEETGHCPNWEQPEKVAADIVAFIEAR